MIREEADWGSRWQRNEEDGLKMSGICRAAQWATVRTFSSELHTSVWSVARLYKKSRKGKSSRQNRASSWPPTTAVSWTPGGSRNRLWKTKLTNHVLKVDMVNIFAFSCICFNESCSYRAMSALPMGSVPYSICFVWVWTSINYLLLWEWQYNQKFGDQQTKTT